MRLCTDRLESLCIVCTDLSGKKPHMQVGVYRMMISGSLGGVMVSTLARNETDVGSNSALDTACIIFVTLII